MPCENPITAYRPANGGPLQFGVPNRAHAGQEKLELPCGRCILCRNEQARQWAVRITHEAQLWDENSFLTLTYSDEHLPKHGSLQHADLQKFWKRLRKQIGKLSYYAVGEYGDESCRPHYHACIFGHAFIADRQILRTTPTLLWTSPTLLKAWGLGHVSVGALNFQTASYTASYVTKQLAKGKRYVRIDEETGELIALQQPKAYMSKRPAIASEWLNKWGDYVYEHDQVVILGKPQKPPRYYDRWLEKRSEIAHAMIKDQRKKNAKPLSKEQTRARARNAHARAKSKSKTV